MNLLINGLKIIRYKYLQMSGNQIHRPLVKSRLEVIQLIYQGLNDTGISNRMGNSRQFIRSIQNQLDESDDVFRMNKRMGAPLNRNIYFDDAVIKMMRADRRM